MNVAAPDIETRDLEADVRRQVLEELRCSLPEEAILAPTAEDEARILGLIRARVDEHSRTELLSGRAPLADDERETVTKRVFDHLLRLGPFQEFLDSDSVEE